MAKPSEHRARIQTAALLAAAVWIIGMLDIPWLTWLALGAVYMLALGEAMALFKIADAVPYLGGGALWLAVGLYPHPGDLVVLGLLVFAALLAYRRPFEARSFLPFLYPTVGFLYMWMLYHTDGMRALLWMVLVVASTDIGAYYTGKNLGKTPFSPTSPNKTLEGVIGGVIGGTVAGAVMAAGWMGIGVLAALIISLIGAKFSIFGDLFESYLKREADVKDSGKILPGHGGVLDRIDGYLFAAPVLYILLQFWNT